MKEVDRITRDLAGKKKKKIDQSERVPEIVVVWWEGEKEERNGSYVMWMWWEKDELAELAIKKEKRERESCKEKWIIAARYVMGFLSLTF